MKIIVTRWGINKNVIGAYSYPKVDSVKAGLKPKILMNPLEMGMFYLMAKLQMPNIFQQFMVPQDLDREKLIELLVFGQNKPEI